MLNSSMLVGAYHYLVSSPDPHCPSDTQGLGTRLITTLTPPRAAGYDGLLQLPELWVLRKGQSDGPGPQSDSSRQRTGAHSGGGQGNPMALVGFCRYSDNCNMTTSKIVRTVFIQFDEPPWF